MNTDLLVSTFNENISYIKTNHKKLFSSLVALDSAVENGHYQEKYELVFDNGYFDVLEKSTSNYLYTQNSYEYAKIVSNSIDFEIKDNLFICSPQNIISDEQLNYYNSLSAFSDPLIGMAPILNHIQKKTNKSEKIKDIQKFIFFGTGLGLHIESVHKKISSKVYLIVEDDLELFRLSLFVTNYKNIAQDSELFFSVFDNDEDFSMISEDFLNFEYQYNMYIKYFQILSHSEHKRNQFHLSITNQAHLRFFYNNYFKQTLLPLENLSDSYQYLDKSVRLSNTLIDKQSFLLLAAGPSLQKNIEWLKKNSNHFIIVAVSATLRLLEKENIKPDIIIHLDAFDASIKHFDLKSIDFIKDAICLFSAKTQPIITLRLDKKQIFFFENGTNYKTNSFKPSSPCVGSIAYQILLYFQVKNIYLLGLDLSINSQTGETHSSSHLYVKKLDLSTDIFSDSEIEYKKNLMPVEGNKSESVLVTPHFQVSIEAINLSTKNIKLETQSVTNFSDGAKFLDTNFMDINEYISDITKDKDIKNELYKLISKKMSTELSKEDKNKLKIKIIDANSLKKSFKNYLEDTTKTTEAYGLKLKGLIGKINENNNTDLKYILDGYLKYLFPYIFDYLNREDIKIDKSDFEIIDKFFIEHLESIC